MQEIIGAMFDSQLFWGVVTLILAAFAFSGKLSMSASNVLLVLAWIGGCFGIYRSPVLHDWYLTAGACLFLGSILAFTASWIQPLPIEKRGTLSVPSRDSGSDPERPDVHIFEVMLQISHNEEGNLLATGIAQVIRNLGKRPAMNVEVRMWLGYDTKPDMTGPPVISYSMSLLEPGPYNPARNHYTTYLSGAYGQQMQLDEGVNIFPAIGVGEPPPPPTPPPFGRRTYLMGTVAFDDSITGRHYSQTLCFEQPLGWPAGRSFNADGRIYAGMGNCK